MKLAKILYTIAIFVITGFVILFSMGCRLGVGAVVNPFGSGETKSVTNEQTTEPFKNIDVDANVVNFHIEEGEGYMVKTEFPSNFDTDVDVAGDTLKVKIKGKKGIDLNLVGFGDIINLGDGLTSKRCDLTIVVPKGEQAGLEDINIVSDAGNIELDGRSFDDINIECDAGNVQVRDCDLGDLNLETSAGNIEFDKISMGDMKIKTNMGNIDLDDVTFGKGTVDSDVGNIEIDGTYDKLEANSDVGAINASSSKDDTVFDLKTDIGAVTVNGSSKGRSYSN